MAGGLFGLLAALTGVNKTTGGETVELPKGAQPSPDAIKLSEKDDNVTWYIPEKAVHPRWDAFLNRGEVQEGVEGRNRYIKQAVAGIPLTEEMQRATSRGGLTGRLEAQYGGTKEAQESGKKQLQMQNAQYDQLLTQMKYMEPYLKDLTEGGAKAQSARNKLEELQSQMGIDLLGDVKNATASDLQSRYYNNLNLIKYAQGQGIGMEELGKMMTEAGISEASARNITAKNAYERANIENYAYDNPLFQNAILKGLLSEQDLKNAEMEDRFGQLRLSKQQQGIAGNALSNMGGNTTPEEQKRIGYSMFGIQYPQYINTGTGFYVDPTTGRYIYPKLDSAPGVNNVGKTIGDLVNEGQLPIGTGVLPGYGVPVTTNTAGNPIIPPVQSTGVGGLFRRLFSIPPANNNYPYTTPPGPGVNPYFKYSSTFYYTP